MKRIFAVLSVIILFFCLSADVKAISSSAKGAVLINGTTGEIIWEKNSDMRLSMASTTKIMTALLLCENGDLDKTIKTTEEMVTVEGSSMGLLPGDTVSYRDLLYGMMLASGNDAANTTAICLGGNTEDFAAMMNDKAKEIGMKNTHFVTPSGLDDDEHYSTAYDMALLARYALSNKDFLMAASSQSATLCYGNPPYRRTLSNHNKLLKTYEGMIGVKTGYTKKSGRCLVTAARRGEGFLIAVTLNCPDDWQEHTKLLDYGFDCLKEAPAKAEVPPYISVAGGSKTQIATEYCEPVLSLTENEWKRLISKVYMPRFLFCDVNTGEVIGKVEYVLDNKIIAVSEIISAESAVSDRKEENKFIKYFMILFKAMI